MSPEIDTTVVAAFGVGMLSFFSPCVLPLVPGYLAAISAGSFSAGQRGDARRVLGPALIFIASFTFVFVLSGLAATGIGQAMTDNTMLLRKVSGVTIIGLGLFMAASLFVPALNFEARSQYLARRSAIGGPLIAGAAFAVAWTPCVGPTLGAILTLAGSQARVSQGAVLLLFYSAGLAVPFLAAAVGLGGASRATDWAKRHYPYILGGAAAVQIVIGVLILTNQFFRLNAWAAGLTSSLNLNL